MNTNKRTISTFIAAALLVVVTAGTSMAMGMGGGINLAPEKQVVFDTIMKAHQAKAEPLKTELWAKERELDALQGNPKAEPARIETLVKEAAELKTKLNAERTSLDDTLKKELGIQVRQGGMCPMMGEGGMQHGNMMKQGGMGGMKGMHGNMAMDNNATMPAGSANHGAHKKQ